ncbi:MAG: ABC transporter ATP-binding protein [Phycisphaerales bacterium]
MNPALEITGLRFAYRPGGALVVDLPGLRIDAGQQWLLEAPSGRGKSTLLHLIAGLLDPQAGQVRVEGRDLHAMRGAVRDAFRGRRIGMIFQTFNLLQGFSALENVMAPLMFSTIPVREHQARAQSLLEELGIERERWRAPAEELSVGQQQRVAVARAIACRPAIVLADEPTASLDPENAAGAMDLIQSSCREAGAALLCVSHDPSMRERFEHRAPLGPVELARAGSPAATS